MRRDGKSNWLNYVLDRSAYWVILLWGGILCLRLVAAQLPLLFLHESVGYPDSYIMLGVESLKHTGVLYPPLGPQHLVPTVYSPFLYWMLAAAWALVPVQNVYIGPRLLEFVWFLLCLTASALLTRRLVPGRKVFFLGLLLAASFSTMTFWVLQLRSDFPGICCSLLALYFLMSPQAQSYFTGRRFGGVGGTV